MQSAHAFDRLTPDFIMDAVESCGYRCDCRILTLNSYENRVYQVGIEDEQPLIVKFYRPQRWSTEQILEEHQFSQQLLDHELPVVAPLVDGDGQTLHTYQGFQFSLSPRKGGQAPELDNLDHLEVIGRLLGRIHLVGASRPFTHRPTLDSQSYGHECSTFISEHFIPELYRESYNTLTRDILQLIDERFARFDHIRNMRPWRLPQREYALAR